MILKTFFFVAMLLLTACSNTEQPNESEQTSQSGETVIELENNEDESERINFNKNSRIASDIYKEFFFTEELLAKSSMESGVVEGNQIAYGNQLPISTDSFPEAYYMDYSFNLEEEILNLALILTEESILKEDEQLTEDVFIHLKYDSGNDTLISLTQENTSGEVVDHIDLTEDEWNEVAKRYMRFVDSIK